MRILSVSAFFESHGGGVEIVAAELARSLGRRGHDSRLIGASFDELRNYHGLTAVPIGMNDPIERFTGLPMPLPTRSGWSIIEQEVKAADVLVIHDALYATSIFAKRCATKYNKPWVLVQHIGNIPYSSIVLRGILAAANRCVTGPMLEKSSQAIFISDTVREYFNDLSYVREPALVFNGIDSLSFFPPDNETPEAFGRPSEVKQRMKLLFVGRFVEKKGLGILRELALRRPEIELMLVGHGPINPAMWRLPNVHVLGRKTREELASIYRSHDALVLPSVGEGFPLVIQEAMACGLPVFCGEDSARADPGAYEFLNGVAIDPRKPKEGAMRLSEAIDSIEIRRMPEAADYARLTYNWDANAVRVEKILMELIESNNH